MAGKVSRGNGSSTPVTIIIHRDEGEEPAHHGGAWKVAYADFVTAMMAFFMLMWLLNVTTEVQRTGLADYFAPTNLFGRSASGSGQPFGGRTPNDAGTSASTDGVPQVIKGRQSPQPDVEEEPTDTPAQPSTQSNTASEDANAQNAAPKNSSGSNQSAQEGQLSGPADHPGKGPQAITQGGDYAAARLTPTPNEDTQLGAAKATAVHQQAAANQTDSQQEQRAMEQAGARLMDAIRRDPALQDVAGQIMIENVPEGLRIQIVDADRKPMFALGGATPTLRVRELMQKVVPALAGLPNGISIAGHTDALTYRGQEKDNWELSTDRANAARRIMLDAGLADQRVRSVTGNADRDLLVPTEATNPANRRITITVLRNSQPEPLSSTAKQ